MFDLYDYQQKLLYDTAVLMKNADRVVAQSSTGSGKTVMFSEICKRLVSKNKKVLILTDLLELKSSTSRTVNKFLRKVGIFSQKKRYPLEDVVIAMSQTVKRRLSQDDFWQWMLRFDYFIIDECHMAHNNQLITDFIIPFKKKLIGFSATPIMPIQNKLLMGDLYEDMALGPPTMDLIDMGKLSKPNYYISGLDSTADFKVKHFEFDPIAVKEAFDKPVIFDSLYQNIIDHKRQNVQSLVFCNDVYHCYKTCDELNKKGIKAKVLTTKVKKPTMPDKKNPLAYEVYLKKQKEYEFITEAEQKYTGDRGQIIKSWESGEFHFLINAKILMTGFDSPTIQDIHLFYSGLSFREYNQRVGRGARVIPDIKNSFNVFDYGQNTINMTPWETQILWQLYKKEDFQTGKKKKNLKACPICNAPLFADFCACGYELVKAIQTREHANLKETNLQKIVTYSDIKDQLEDNSVKDIIASDKLPYAKMLRFIWINKKERGLAEFAKEKQKNIHKFVYELANRKFNLTPHQELEVKSIFKTL